MSESELALFVLKEPPKITTINHGRVVVGKLVPPGTNQAAEIQAIVLKELSVVRIDEELWFHEKAYKSIARGTQPQETIIGFARKKLTPKQDENYHDERKRKNVLSNYLTSGEPTEFHLIKKQTAS